MPNSPTPNRTEDEKREAGQIAYETRFAHLGPKYFDPWHSLEPEVKAIWVRVEADSTAQTMGEVGRLMKELSDAASVIMEANNSLYGSQGYFLSMNGGPPNKYHLADAVEKLKKQTRDDYAARGAAEARASAAEAEIARLKLRDQQLGYRAEAAEAIGEALRERVARLEVDNTRLRKDNERLRWRHPAVLPDWNDLPEALRVKLAETAEGFDPDWGGDLIVNLYRDLREGMNSLPSPEARAALNDGGSNAV